MKEIKGNNIFNNINADTTEMLEECYEFVGYKEIMLKLKEKEEQNFKESKNKNFVKKKIYVYLSSTDQYINYATSCYNTDPFEIIEEQLYSKFPQLKNKNVLFLANGNVIKKSLSLEENKINNGTHILINEND